MRWIIALLCLIALGAGIFVLFTPHKEHRERDAPQTNDETPENTASAEVPLITSTKEERLDRERHIAFHRTLPAVSFLDDERCAKNATNHFRDTADKASGELLTLIATGTNTGTKEYRDGHLTIGFTPLLAAPDFISIRFDDSLDPPDGSPSVRRTFVANFDCGRQAGIDTETLFASSSEALLMLSRETISRLRAEFPDIPENTFTKEYGSHLAPDTRNYRSVGITTEGLVVFFDPGTIALPARGTIAVNIPMSSVGSSLSSTVRDAITLARLNYREAVPEETTDAGGE